MSRTRSLAGCQQFQILEMVDLHGHFALWIGHVRRGASKAGRVDLAVQPRLPIPVEHPVSEIESSVEGSYSCNFSYDRKIELVERAIHRPFPSVQNLNGNNFSCFPIVY